MATRRTQPYRRGARAPGQALTAMLRGRAIGGMNPTDVSRAISKLQAWPPAGQPKRVPRPARPARPARPQR